MGSIGWGPPTYGGALSDCVGSIGPERGNREVTGDLEEGRDRLPQVLG